MIRVHSKSGRYIALLPETLTGGFSVVVTANGVSDFKNSWPCSVLGEQPIRFDYAANGDLVDLSTDRDGEDVLALSQDAQEFGEKCLEKRRNPTPKKQTIKCDQCEAAMINGVFCHETGCLNSRKTWVPDRGWIRFYECRECSAEIEQGESCDCQ